MKTTGLAGMLMLTVLFSGCGPLASLYPLWDRDHLISEPGLIGTWISDEDEVLKIVDAGNLKYGVTFADGDGVSRYEARLVCLDGRLYLDLFPDAESLSHLLSAQAYLPVIPTHFFARVSVSSATLEIALLDEETLARMVDRGEVDIPLLKWEEGLLLAAETGRVQELLVRCSDDERFWEEAAQFHRRGSPQ